MSDEHIEQPPLWERIAIFVFGVTFVAVLLTLAFVYPYPTPNQYTVSRIVLALSASAVATLLTGFIIVKIPGIAKAGGALAVFLIVYFYSPAALVVNDLSTVRGNMSSKMYGAAQSQLESIVKLAPDYPEALNLLGHVYWKQTRTADARAKFYAAADLANGHNKDRYLFNAAAAELVLGNYRQADNVLEAVKSRDEKDPATSYNLGIAKGQLGQYDEARALFANLYNDGPRAGKDYRSLAKLQLGVLVILERGEAGVPDAVATFKEAIFFDRALDLFFLRCSSVVNDEELSVEGRVIDRVLSNPAYQTFKQGLANGLQCPPRITS